MSARPALALAALLVLAGCATPADGPGDEPPAEEPTTEPAPEPTVEEPTEDPTAEEPPAETETDPGEGPDVATAPVYFLADTRAGFRLVRELRDLTGDPAVAAVETMIAGPLDPDYVTTWDPGTTVRSVTAADDGWVVDLSAEARTANVGSEGAAMMLQQLVWTVTEAVGEPDAPVTLTIDGEPAGELWGVLEASGPQLREDPLTVRGFVQIDSHAEGARVGSPVTVSGEAAVFEATVLWRVLDADGVVVDEGFTQTAEGQVFSPFSLELRLDPGTWTLVVEESDPSDGEGGSVMSDSRTLVVE